MSNLDDFENEQKEALIFCVLIYDTDDETLKRPIECVVPGCNNPFIYNSGMCVEHAF